MTDTTTKATMSRPTAKQKRLWSKVAENCCMACRVEGVFDTPCEIHHARENGGYRDHNKVYGLCPAHHRDTAAVPGVPNRHGDPIEFKRQYGTDSELFNRCMELIRG